CDVDLRRHLVRGKTEGKGRPNLNGIDYLEVSDDQLQLRVFFLAKAPHPISKKNFVITGGQRVTDIRVIDIDVCRVSGKDLDDCLTLTVNKPGDFSDYTLKIVELDKKGHPTNRPLRGFDRRFAHIVFSFKAGCPSDFDCLPRNACVPAPPPPIDLNYLAKDYASFRQAILDRMALTMPEWKERHVPDIGIALVEVLAYVADHLSYYQDAVATEAYLDTARQRISVRRHARLVDYRMHEGCNARMWVFVETIGGSITVKRIDFAFIAGLKRAAAETGGMITRDGLRLLNPSQRKYEVFEPMGPAEFTFTETHNRILFYTWGDFECCLAKGTTSATLIDEYLPDPPPPPPNKPGYKQAQGYKPPPKKPPVKRRKLNLRPGDVLIFEEVISPKTGEAADKDLTRRHAVWLTQVTPDEDELTGQPLVQIEWAEADALPFTLCISSTGSAPDCEKLDNVTIARGNVVLVDHGRTIGGGVVDDSTEEDLGTVPAEESLAECGSVSCAPEVTVTPGRYHPVLDEAPLTHAASLPVVETSPDDESQEDPCPKEQISAYGLMRQDPRQALPQVQLMSRVPGDVTDLYWQPRYDLLGSLVDDLHYVVETDNRTRAHLRFSNGEMGRAPISGEQFRARYRIGNGNAGNVGAEAISHIVLRDSLSGIELRPRNPMSAGGGTEPEDTDRVRLFAPFAFRTDLQRAITAEDYAELAQRHPQVQKAMAVLRWTGAWYEVNVAIDPKSQAESPERLLDEVECLLRPFRRIGHDVRVTRATYVPLDIEMRVCIKPDYLTGHVKAELLDVFSNRVLPDGRLGFFHPDNLTFGAGIMISKLVALAHSVTGVENVIVTRLQRYREVAGRELGDGILKIGPLEVARLDNDLNSPENGKIAFTMMGGR
ncbi:MAG TPA: putative baseplate assembly protein, partial [Pyrinomonadaceae bacterium]|nr:putative baseplate assembly protein [Pyrinomonadaceae bacterium]